MWGGGGQVQVHPVNLHMCEVGEDKYKYTLHTYICVRWGRIITSTPCALTFLWSGGGQVQVQPLHLHLSEVVEDKYKYILYTYISVRRGKDKYKYTLHTNICVK